MSNIFLKLKLKIINDRQFLLQQTTSLTTIGIGASLLNSYICITFWSLYFIICYSPTLIILINFLLKVEFLIFELSLSRFIKYKNKFATLIFYPIVKYFY